MEQYWQELQQQVHRKAALERKQDALCEQRRKLKEELDTATQRWQEEKKDVDKLEGISLTGIFSALSGRKEEQLEKERQEAQEALLQKEAADKAAAAVAAEAIARYNMKFSKELLGGGKTCSDALNAAKIEAFGKADDAADYGSDWKVTYVSNKVTAMNEANKGTYAIDFEEPFCN